jgi:hypothetical protein
VHPRTGWGSYSKDTPARPEIRRSSTSGPYAAEKFLEGYADVKYRVGAEHRRREALRLLSGVRVTSSGP